MSSQVIAFAQPREASSFPVNLMAFGEMNNDSGEAAFAGIIGQSSGLRHVLQLVEKVAATNATVLLLGETGTGKELIARAIHERSPRKTQPLVAFNCAAVPGSLFESEFFGHERGAFTGAHMQRAGRLELADRGTLFLDEVGELPPELQPKLLRLLQERTYERVGSSRTRNVDIRLVAATNQNLEEMVGECQFRSDLYYRLNVFPIRIPPLRERRQDIPLLVRHFTKKYSRQIGKRIDTVSEATLQSLMSWHWPGNIRELQNVIERCVILAEDAVLRLEPGALPAETQPAARARSSGQKAEIEAILRETNGRVAGPRGAAARMGVPVTTLASRIRALKINKHRFHQT
ncbi:MAG: sigma 54-interacting transcriptional regulator [Acidobacteria bacterium]|nr:sigma 54-interacting transcriptional regulator [Acidobacteriota bacterium]